MTLEKKIRDLILHYVRVKYNSYLSKHNIFIINDNEIDNVINSLYNNEKTDLINFIQNSLTFEKNSYSKSVVDNLISDIFKDNDLCKNRLRKEINQYHNL